jgi:hypothetical protein
MRRCALCGRRKQVAELTRPGKSKDYFCKDRQTCREVMLLEKWKKVDLET